MKLFEKIIKNWSKNMIVPFNVLTYVETPKAKLHYLLNRKN